MAPLLEQAAEDPVPRPQGRSVRLKAAAWNAQGLDFKTLSYCADLDYDVLALTETKGVPKASWIADLALDQRIFTGEPCKPNDLHSGVAILLSTSAARMVKDSGKIGSRIVWVRLAGLFYDTIFVCVYIPQPFRSCRPFQEDTMLELETLCRTLEQKGQRDCQVVLGDFNSKLPRGLSGLTGRYCMHYKADSGGTRLLDIMSTAHLMAASTCFCPARKHPRGQGTFISTAKTLSQIDYVLCSQRYQSNISGCKVQWGPSVWRHGQPQDHGLIQFDYCHKIKT